LENFEIAGVASFLPAALDPFLFESIFGRTIALIEDAPFDSAQDRLRRREGERFQKMKDGGLRGHELMIVNVPAMARGSF